MTIPFDWLFQDQLILPDDGQHRTWQMHKTDKHGIQYQGFVNDKGKMDGPGYMIDIGQSIYEGFWKNGKRDGWGRGIFGYDGNVGE